MKENQTRSGIPLKPVYTPEASSMVPKGSGNR